MGEFEVRKFFSVGADVCLFLGHQGKVIASRDENKFSFEEGDGEQMSVYAINARFDFGYPVWLFYPHAFVGVGGYSAHLGSNATGNMSFECGMGLDFCIQNHFVMGFLWKGNAFLNLGSLSTCGVNLGWRF